jgi:mono/diheme cytochrome c family protein
MNRIALIASTIFFGAMSLQFASASTLRPQVPDSIALKGQTVVLKDLSNPLPLDADNLQAGKEVYFQNCFLCHGDLLDGNGVLADRFFPKPASFIHKSSPLTQSDAYIFWRIAKGGKGLPPELKPWNSAMPAWENQLSPQQIWQVIHFLQSKVKARLALETSQTSETPTVEKGQSLYNEHCAICHGDEANGQGIGAAYSSPQPRDLTKGHIKLRSTAFGKLPIDDDIMSALDRGMNGTTMPSWKHLPESDKESLILFMKSISSKHQKFVDRKKEHEIISVPDAIPFTLESRAKGKELYIRNCSGCHGIKGRSDGMSTHKIVNIETDAIWPRNLSKSWTFRRGGSREQIFKTIRTGLTSSAMPRFSERVFTDEQIWDIVNYVVTLSPQTKPKIKPLLKVQRISGELPEESMDPVWKQAESYFYPLGGQILEAEKSYFSTTDSVVVKGLHNGQEVAFYIHWDDPNYDPLLENIKRVKESPPPPLPPELQTNEAEHEIKELLGQKFPDAIALQFPVNLDGETPYFLNGAPQNPVNLWRWTSTPYQAVEMNAEGLGANTEQSKQSQSLKSQVQYKYGRYYLVIKRKLITDDKENDVQFQPGKITPIAFNVWNGSEGEHGTKMAISSWFDMVLK